MTQEEKQDLTKYIGSIFKDVDLKDATAGLTYVDQNTTLKREMENKLNSFFENAMNMNVVSASSPFVDSSSFF